MYIVMIAPECAPVAKVGGLGDVVFGLSRELEIRGNSVEIILPKYDCLRYDQIFDLQLAFKDLWVPWYDYAVHCSVYFGFVHGRKCFFIEPHSDHNFFNRRAFYGQVDDDQRFAFFSRAALEFMLKSNKHPDIIHCHDWQTGLVPVLLYEMYKHVGMTHPRVCYTLHNLQHQGVTREHILRATGLNRHAYFFHQDRLQDNFNHAAINLMKGGIVYSNFVTTVSPHYAWEILNTTQNFGLGHTLQIHRDKVGGILNGMDYDVWNPEIDRHIPRQYGINSLDDKYENKQALRQRFWLQDALKPIVCYIGRLDEQKGVPLITHAIHYCLSHGCQFVLLGTSAGRPHRAPLLAPQAALQRQPGLPPRAELQRGTLPPDLCRRGDDRGPQPVRAVRPDADDRAEIRHRAHRARDRRPGGHRVRRQLRRAGPTTSATAMSSTISTPRASSPPCTAPSACGTPTRSTSAS